MTSNPFFADALLMCIVPAVALTALLVRGKIPLLWPLFSIAAKMCVWGFATYWIFYLRTDWYKNHGYLPLEKVTGLAGLWFLAFILGHAFAALVFFLDKKEDQPVT